MSLQLDFAQENLMFESAAGKMSMRLEKLPGGFYADQGTQHAWALWIHRAALTVEILAMHVGESQ
ncbi:hypothetical protein [Pseudomonas syringae]|uniref:hypothetical protein n=1 Tax=Pseudomonas syringae TaxID=317 RepID=UPI0018E60015|nr:hypothetical protein [Pseudomonas syringae]MBI6740406.1 hypothetical protein [Pseudomonas syringae]MBI6745973.1 hypothetical protein [Pseudomonas syringae]MBI6760388.1 hypothetical protein [Pseudomonas syringae]MBI6808794.1 hypothetical protein [Pseudomonas syringae]MBI6829463.1 hypothetical protein [Pseudomonas syringae]